MTFKELRAVSGMTQQAFANYFDIPKRTIENWDSERRKCPEYLLKLMEYKLGHDKHGKWVGDWDFHCSICGEFQPEYDPSNPFKFCPECGAKMDK